MALEAPYSGVTRIIYEPSSQHFFACSDSKKLCLRSEFCKTIRGRRGRATKSIWRTRKYLSKTSTNLAHKCLYATGFVKNDASQVRNQMRKLFNTVIVRDIDFARQEFFRLANVRCLDA